NDPPAHSTPSPFATPVAIAASPAMKNEKPTGDWPSPRSTIVSGDLVPVAVSLAPSKLNEFAQPASGAPLGLGTKFGATHGHGVASEPSPKQNAVPGASSRFRSTVMLPRPSLAVTRSGAPLRSRTAETTCAGCSP